MLDSPHKLEIIVEPDALPAKNLSDRWTGVIYWRVSGNSFPETGWNDFPGIISTWWMKACDSLNQGAVTACFSFMDGPFEVRASREASLVQLAFVMRGRTEIELFKADISLNALTSVIKSTCLSTQAFEQANATSHSM